MPFKKKTFTFIIYFLFPLMSYCQLTSRQERNITAFVKIYGYVRFFHPSDEAQQIDWGKFAIYGNQVVLDAPNDVELINRLNAIFKPIAPSIQISLKDNMHNFRLSKITPVHPNSFKVISWQHLGLDIPGGSTDYKSMRTNRLSRSEKAGNKAFHFYPLMSLQSMDKFAGKEITIRVSLKGNANSTLINSMMLSGGSDTISKPVGYLDADVIGHRIDTVKRFYNYKINARNKSLNLLVGLYIQEGTNMSINDFSMFTSNSDGSKTELPVKKYQGEPVSRLGFDDIYAIRITDSTAAEDKSDQLLFSQQFKIGEYIEKDIVSGISCVIPLALYGNSAGTFPAANTAKLNDLKKHIIADIPTDLTAKELSVRLGAITISWNAFKHFFPYWEGASMSADVILHEALSRAYSDKDPHQFLKTLKLVYAPLNDGHMFTELFNDTTASAAPLLGLAFVNNKIVIKDIIDPKLKTILSPGDIIKNIDGKPVVPLLIDQEKLVSGSPQYKRFKALIGLLNGAYGSHVRLLISHNGRLYTKVIDRNQKAEIYRRGSYGTTAVSSSWVKSGIYYSNLTTDSLAALGKAMPDLLKAKAIIFDLRGYPVGNINELLNHIMVKAENTNWIFMPEIRYPDYQQVSYSGSGWHLVPQQPILHAKLYFLTDASTMSYAESLLGYIKSFKLATIVGEPSAGANGEINYVYLPGNYRISFSGLTVTCPDGTNYHGKGIQPDVIMHRTLAGIRLGKDEILEKAVQLSLTKAEE